MNLLGTPELLDATLQNPSTTLGRVVDIYVDRVQWKVCYFGVETGNWAAPRHACLAPSQIEQWDLEQGKLFTQLSPGELKQGPDLPAPPISPQPAPFKNWQGGQVPPYQLGSLFDPQDSAQARPPLASSPQFSQLQSVNALTDVPAFALGKRVGTIHGLILDLDKLVAPYFSLDLGSWFASDLVAIPTGRGRLLLGETCRLELERSPEQIEHAPRLTPHTLAERGDAELVEYFGEGEASQCALH